MNETSPHIVVLGGPALDQLAYVPYFPPNDGNVVAKRTERQPGGVGANIAVGLAHLGNQVTLLGSTGDDETGRFLRRSLRQSGVNVSHMLIRTDTLTHSCFIAITPRGERRIYGLPGATTVERPEELDRQALRKATALHIAPAYKAVAQAAIATAREAGLVISYTPADVWWPHGPEVVREIARTVDLLIVNRVEAAALTGLDNPQAAIQRLVDWGYGPTALTHGKAGVLLGDRGKVMSIPAYSVQDVRDTTGVGDAFTAGIITGMLMKLSLSHAARLGTAVAALKLRGMGAQAGLPSLEEAMSLAMQPPESTHL